METELPFWQFSQEIILPGLVQGLMLTLELTLWSGFFGILLGLVLSLMRISQQALFRWFVVAYVTLFRGTPLLLQILFIYFALPSLIDLTLDAKTCGVLALSLNAGAYLAEVFRAAVQSIDKGQMEAARALGMSYSVSMRRIILPQTFRRLLPPIVNELAALAKDTSLVSAIALSEVLFVTQRLGAKYLRPWEVYFWAAMSYLLIVVLFTTLASYLEKQLAKRDA